jgi:hypothetical protein
MANEPPASGMVGPFWVVEAEGNAAVIAVAVPLDQADTYGDMVTLDKGHLEHWIQLSQSGARALRNAGIPTAPVWSECEEWPRGRVIYDLRARRFIIRADRQLHRPAFIRLILDRFGIASNGAAILPNDHYRSVRRLAAPEQPSAWPIPCNPLPERS